LFRCLLTMTTRHSCWIYMDPGGCTSHASPARSDRPLFPSRSKRQMVSMPINVIVVSLLFFFLNPRINKPLMAELGCPHTTCAVSGQFLIRERCPEIYEAQLAGINNIFTFQVLSIPRRLCSLHPSLFFAFPQDVFS
jgi:hypothetical protein